MGKLWIYLVVELMLLFAGLFIVSSINTTMGIGIGLVSASLRIMVYFQSKLSEKISDLKHERTKLEIKREHIL